MSNGQKGFTKWQLAIIGWVWIVLIPLGIWKLIELLIKLVQVFI